MSLYVSISANFSLRPPELSRLNDAVDAQLKLVNDGCLFRHVSLKPNSFLCSSTALAHVSRSSLDSALANSTELQSSLKTPKVFFFFYLKYQTQSLTRMSKRQSSSSCV
jgi:hypothetical protein